MGGAWGAAADFGNVCRRAGGRKRYNLARQKAAQVRLGRICCLTTAEQRRAWGVQAELARALGVSRSTISRDFAALRRGVKWRRL